MINRGDALEPRIAGILAEGKLRVGLFPSFFYARSEAGELSGWGIEMARDLARRLGVELQPVERADPPAVVAALAAGDCDVAFLGISRERAAEVEFTPPWMRGEFTFLVAADSAVRAVGDLEGAGVRIGVVVNHAMDTALSGKLVNAERVYADTPDAAFALFQAGRVNALAGIRPGLISYSAKAPGSRVLADAYGANVIGLAVAKGEADWLAFLSAYVAETKASGSAHAAAEQSGTHGLDVLP